MHRFPAPPKYIVAIMLIGLVSSLAFLPAQDRTRGKASLAEILRAAISTPTGFCVYVGVTDGDLLIGLAGEGRHLVHGLAADQAAVEKARQKIVAAKLSGVVSVEVGPPGQLPYSDSLVSLLVVDNLDEQLAAGLQMEEVLRVLRPGGVAWLGETGNALDEAQLRKLLATAGVDPADIELLRTEGHWMKIVKPRPESIDEWTHRDRDATGNRVSSDKEIGVPTGVRWVTGPNWPTGYRKSSVPGVVASGNRLVYIFEDEVETKFGRESRNSLIARDPFNGLPLWKRPTTKKVSPLICVGDRVYTVVEDGGPLVALDASTGEVIRTYSGTESPEKVLHIDGKIVVEVEDRLGCLDAETGDVLWKVEARPKNYLAAEGQVFAHVDASRRGGDSEFIAVDLQTGNELWHTATDDWSKGGCDLILYHNGVLVAASSRGNHAVSARDGKHLWSYDYPLIGHGGSFRKIVGIDGLVWVHAAAFEGKKQYAWEGLDPISGKVVKRVVQPKEFQYKHRCSYDVATQRYFMCGSMDFADLETGQYDHFEAARNSCSAAGAVPANGLLYTFPHACGCYPMLRGYLGLETGEVPESAEVLFTGERLVKGPAYGTAASADAAPGRWPTYRHDPLRSGSTENAGPAKLKTLWSAEIAAEPQALWSAEWKLKDGGRLSSPVVADGLALVAAADEHRLVAVDADNGEHRWSFTAGGRIDCPPTVHQGLCLLGARDGTIYCLRMRDGALAWKFEAAPMPRRLMAYGQLESAWPVVGGVLVYDGLAYFALGRHSAADGGVFVGALEPQTGRLVWAQRPEDFPGVPDVLNGADGTVQMASWEFDAKTGDHREAKEGRLQGGRLGLLNDAWYERPIALRKNLQLWTTTEGVSGQTLAYRNDASCVFHACSKVSGGTGEMSGNALLSGRSGSRKWDLKMPLGVQLQSLVLTPDRIYAAGVVRDEDPGSPREQFLRIHALGDGKLLDETPLDGPPVHDGLAVANGRVYVATENGRLICLGEE